MISLLKAVWDTPKIRPDRYFLFLPFSLIEMKRILSQFVDWELGTLGDHLTVPACPHVPMYPQIRYSRPQKT